MLRDISVQFEFNCLVWTRQLHFGFRERLEIYGLSEDQSYLTDNVTCVISDFRCAK